MVGWMKLRRGLFPVMLSVGLGGGAVAQTTRPTSQPAGEAATQPVAVTEKHPGFQLQRWREDYRYLAGPIGADVADWFDPIKYIDLGEPLHLSLGGSVRGRLESRTNNFINLPSPSQDTTFLWRTFLHADLRYGDAFRVYVEGIFAAIEDNDSPRLPITENRGDFYQYFADVRVVDGDVPVTVRVGRQELLYGKQRFFSPLDWSNTRRRFDGFKVFAEAEDWKADVFYVHTVPDTGLGFVDRIDQYNERQYLLGLYTSYTGIPRHGLDFYYLYMRNANEPTNANGNTGSLNLHTFGGRLWGRTAGFDYDTELTGQFGDFADDSLQAWSWSSEAGYTFSELDWTPRVGIGLDYASGDPDPADSQHQTFNQLFPLGHAYLGYMDLVARQNIWAVQANVQVKPTEAVTARMGYHAFWLDESQDGLFNAGGVLLRRDLTGTSGKEIGQELDITLNWKIDRHSALQVGYAHFWNGGFINETGLGDDADFVYVQYEFKF